MKFDGLYLSKAIDDYSKRDFQNILFVKFSSQHNRDKFVEKFRRANLLRDGNRVWYAPDELVDVGVQK
eukprot:1674606-Karenia_brevis.AAC.1